MPGSTSELIQLNKRIKLQKKKKTQIHHNSNNSKKNKNNKKTNNNIKAVLNLKIEQGFAVFDLSDQDIKNTSFYCYFEENKLYVPSGPLFPLVDGFYITAKNIFLL